MNAAVISLLPQHASAGFDEPLAMIAACHERAELRLQLLERLADHLREQGADGAARDAAQDVLRYFEQAAPLHHADEEQDLFPVLRRALTGARDGEPMLRVMQLLERHHRELDTAWAQLAPPLRGIAAGTAAMLDRDAVDDFAAHYRVHITVENEVLLPRAKQLLDAAVCARLGERMAARRA